MSVIYLLKNTTISILQPIQDLKKSFKNLSSLTFIIIYWVMLIYKWSESSCGTFYYKNLKSL